jgi:hypothetical protein
MNTRQPKFLLILPVCSVGITSVKARRSLQNTFSFEFSGVGCQVSDVRIDISETSADRMLNTET